LRTILSFIKDGFSVSKRHNPTHGGVLFSQLPEETQAQILAYEVSVDLLINLPDAEILDIFSRLNSYAVILNEQEKINADHFGSFKLLSENVGHKYNAFWTTQGIVTSKQVMRMLEINLVADLIIAMLEGIKSKKQIKKYYDLYEKNFDKNIVDIEKRFDSIIEKIAALYPEGLSDTEFRRPHLFYSLFIYIAHRMYGVPELPQNSAGIPIQIDSTRDRLEVVDDIFSEEDITRLTPAERTFLDDSRRATTDEAVRKRRTEFLLEITKS
jgi:hypothetical protein